MNCPRCGTPMQGVCPNCGFPVTGVKVMLRDDIKIPQSISSKSND